MKDNHKADVSHTDEFDKMFQEMVKQAEDDYKVKSEYPETEEEVGLVDKFSSRWVNEFNLPNGYIFKDENGNVINATKIVLEKKKKEYPKTYKECYKVLGIEYLSDSTLEFFEHGSMVIGQSSYQHDNLALINTFIKLKLCRDAYWKIAGEEMGLGKPWEPDWNEETDKFTISNKCNKIYLNNTAWYAEVLSFPTAEMRDTFKKNFDPDIEFCKELL